MGFAASDRTGADRPTPKTRVALGVTLATLLLFAPGAVATGRAIAKADGDGMGGPAATSRRAPAPVRGSQAAKRPSDVIRRCQPLSRHAGAGRLSRETNQASSADPACEELSASEYSLVWPSLQATVLTITPTYGVCFDVSRPVRGSASRPLILPFTPRPPPA
jgi:hypothetical protein